MIVFAPCLRNPAAAGSILLPAAYVNECAHLIFQTTTLARGLRGAVHGFPLTVLPLGNLMKNKEKIKAVAYIRTSSAANVGADKDSEKRQRAANRRLRQAGKLRPGARIL